MRVSSRLLAPVATAAMMLGASASAELSYTYLDFQYVGQTVDATGLQTTPGTSQTVGVTLDGGDGISVAGSMAIGPRFYLAGFYQSSIVDVDGVITNPLGVTNVADNFDLISSRILFGYQYALADTLHAIAELSYDSMQYDFGSFAGENFDLDDGGVGAGLGLRWNPTEALELNAIGRFSPVAEPLLDTLELDSGSLLSLGAVWYILPDLGFGLTFESGDVETATFTMRFSFGNLPW